MSACDLVKTKQRSRKRSRKGDGIGVARIVGVVAEAEEQTNQNVSIFFRICKGLRQSGFPLIVSDEIVSAIGNSAYGSVAWFSLDHNASRF